jgi:hypothetical protein
MGVHGRVFTVADPPPVPQCVTVSVPATAGGTDLVSGDGTPPVNTGLTVSAGNQVNISASGTLTIFGATPNITNGPNGLNYSQASDRQFLLQDSSAPGGESALVAGALIGKIGSSSYQYFGASKQFTAGSTGIVFLGVNDIANFFKDNIGSFQVQVCRQ